MPVCRYCGKKYAYAKAKKTFCCEYANLRYSQFREDLCGPCAIIAIEDDDDGIYYEKCDECGCEFDFGAEECEFSSFFDPCGSTKLTDYWKSNRRLCASCALGEI